MNENQLENRTPPELWDEKQLLERCEGYKEFSSGTIELSYKVALECLELKSGDSILDIGCGRGEIIKECSKITPRAVGIDYSIAAVKIARDYAGCGNIVQCSATNLPFKDNTFKYVTILGFMECLNQEDLKLCVQESKRVLTNNGTILITTPNSLGVAFFTFCDKAFHLLTFKKKQSISNWYGSPLVRSTMNYFSLRSLLRKNGLKYRIWFDRNAKGRLPGFIYKILFFTAPIYCLAQK
jgi:ubiquinone/menaquinone biosynthesis C-methylase UbiE